MKRDALLIYWLGYPNHGPSEDEPMLKMSMKNFLIRIVKEQKNEKRINRKSALVIRNTFGANRLKKLGYDVEMRKEACVEVPYDATKLSTKNISKKLS